MRGDRALTALTMIWVGAFILSAAIPVALYMRGTVGPESAVDAIKQTGAAFVPYVGLILSYVFARGRSRAGARRHANRLAIVTALTTSIAWNLAVLGPLALTLNGESYLEDATSQMRELSSYLSWLVAPALGYFFGAPNRNTGDVAPVVSA